MFLKEDITSECKSCNIKTSKQLGKRYFIKINTNKSDSDGKKFTLNKLIEKNSSIKFSDAVCKGCKKKASNTHIIHSSYDFSENTFLIIKLNESRFEFEEFDPDNVLISETVFFLKSAVLGISFTNQFNSQVENYVSIIRTVNNDWIKIGIDKYEIIKFNTVLNNFRILFLEKKRIKNLS